MRGDACQKSNPETSSTSHRTEGCAKHAGLLPTIASPFTPSHLQAEMKRLRQAQRGEGKANSKALRMPGRDASNFDVEEKKVNAKALRMPGRDASNFDVK